MWKWIAIPSLLMLIFACWPNAYHASTSPQDDLTITYTVEPKFGFHSDWTRSVSVKFGAAEIHEGQNGCFGFELSPLSFEVRSNISCKKRNDARRQDGDASPYYEDLIYLGGFFETPSAPDGVAIRFIPVSEKAEVELPDIL
ncbi:hypothetical protein Q4544_07990 [Cognatishimia sp. 1_MG-2023]|uniref:hypothetical protein n=1 Tax=Cognatishimia sp. 1_MG-2023 TaxID=3062642 RepID=UPI0026E3C7D2|nr:hypothetical protein [Cognatishimia sp. 1_MG-2023]MDO6726869.1 hypothetical protein [Cognatishimia sp. 1_MG-2023]